MILLDTNALLFLLTEHRRARPLRRHELAMSPLSLLELKMLEEVGRARFLTRVPPEAFMSDPRWVWDDLGLQTLIASALDITFTRDPFDRLLAAHAMARGWRLATADSVLIEHLPARFVLEL
jgi:PIN domain nuclease of toxin-antitoxin system